MKRIQIFYPYKIVDSRRLKKILKYGLNPRLDTKIKQDNKFLISDLDSEDFRTYFIAEPNKRKLQNAVKDVVENLRTSDFGTHEDDTEVTYAVIKIDLNIFAENHRIFINAYEDPRHGAPSFWTAEFFPPSCINHVSKMFRKILKRF